MSNSGRGGSGTTGSIHSGRFGDPEPEEDVEAVPSIVGSTVEIFKIEGNPDGKTLSSIYRGILVDIEHGLIMIVVESYKLIEGTDEGSVVGDHWLADSVEKGEPRMFEMGKTGTSLRLIEAAWVEVDDD